ncbi:SigE family RNA polymerase sigma factor [Actinopolymorpha alba]|uniref:SigE family RNA polymerase sigma factor n=1 Tax=Actinopolymorpha alba TaxID=533267 RepID=UPI0003634B2C|nr:SigE family RNA polymerase sigma factor [Actinopolymorpha alba]
MGRGDDAEFVEFVHGSARALRRTAYLLCGDWHRAEDAVQQAFIKLYVAWPRLRKTETFGAYARRAVISAVIDDARRPWRRRERVVESFPEDTATTDGSFAGIDNSLAMVEALRELPPRQRAVLVLRYLDDLSVEQTAEVLQIDPGTVKSQTSRGLANLRRLLGPLAGADATTSGEHERTAR